MEKLFISMVTGAVFFIGNLIFVENILSQEQMSISGKILLPDGTPLANEKVKFVYAATYSMPSAIVKTQENGSFKLKLPQPYQNIREAKVFAKNCELGTTIEIPDEDETITIKLEEGDLVEGKVYFKDKNTPFYRVNISVFAADIPIYRLEDAVRTVKSKEDGSFSFKLAKGEYNIVFNKKGAYPVMEEIDISPKKPVHLEAVLKEQIAITGKITGDDIKGVTISLQLVKAEEPALQSLLGAQVQNRNTRPKKDGTFKFDNVIYGTYRVMVQKEFRQIANQEVIVEEGEPATVEIEIEE